MVLVKKNITQDSVPASQYNHERKMLLDTVYLLHLKSSRVVKITSTEKENVTFSYVCDEMHAPIKRTIRGLVEAKNLEYKRTGKILFNDYR